MRERESQREREREREREMSCNNSHQAMSKPFSEAKGE